MKKITNNTPFMLILIGLALIIVPIIIDVLVGLFSNSETVGANIGAGILFIFAAPLIIVGTVWYGLSQKGMKRILILLFITSLVGWWIINWNIQENRRNEIFCREKYQNKEQVPDYDSVCLKYL